MSLQAKDAEPITGARRNGPLRIGHYSADFHDHATTYLIKELFELHDRSKVEAFDVRTLSDREVTNRSRQMGIDIAVDLKGITQDSRSGIYAEKVGYLPDLT